MAKHVIFFGEALVVICTFNFYSMSTLNRQAHKVQQSSLFNKGQGMVNGASRAFLPHVLRVGYFIAFLSTLISISVFADVTQGVKISGQNFPCKRLSLTQVQLLDFKFSTCIFQCDLLIPKRQQRQLRYISICIVPIFCSFVIIIKHNLPEYFIIRYSSDIIFLKVFRCSFIHSGMY